MAKRKSKYAKGKHPNSLANIKEHGFKPGQSGNPKGRPPNIKYVSEALRELLAEDKSLAYYLAKNLAKRALKNSGDLSLLFERTEGKVTQPIGGDPNMPIVVEKIVAHVTEENNGSGSSPGR